MPSKTLVIAEKPSVAGDIARALGISKKDNDYYENETYVVSSAVGHLLEMVAPEGAEVKRGKWSLANLPVLPDSFDLKPIKMNENRLRVLSKLYKRKDIGALINACDAGREGELIFRNIVRYFNGKKTNANAAMPIQRLWLSSMTPAAIRKGFDELKKDEEVLPLKDAAESRAQADWFVGINATRAMTALHSAAGGFFLTTVGRVQTPTLTLMVEREREIKAFVPQTYWEVAAAFEVAAGEYEGVWTDTEKKKDKEAKKPERIFSFEAAEKILAECAVGTPAHATETVKPSSEAAPMLLDLTTLQREANNRFGLPAKSTLAAAQALYERYKLITYPRTDSRFLPEDYPAVVKKTLQSLGSDNTFGTFAKRALDNQWVRGGNRKIFNNAKVSDHFAIIPTGVAMRDNLPERERKLYQFIVSRFIAVFFPPAKYLVTERKTMVGEHCFLSKGRVLKEAGWREVERAAAKPTSGGKKDAPITALADGGEDTQVAAIQSEEKQTTPPPRYSEATLLSAMESAGKLTDDEELREAMREKGLGTPATRAAIIEGLMKEKYIVRDMRQLKATPKADSLIRLLSALKIDSLTKPAMTGEWECQLRRIEKAQIPAEKFIREIKAMTAAIVDAAKNCRDVEKIEGDFAELQAPCPACGKTVRESHRRFSCQSCEFSIWKTISGRELSVDEAEALLASGETAELDGFRSRLGREFAAKVFLRQDKSGSNGAPPLWRAVFDFGETETDSLSADEIKEKEAVAPCPKCGATVRQMQNSYVCEKGLADSGCDFKFSRRILQQEITPEQLTLLLTEGQTAVLQNFISKKTRRPFKARLSMDLPKKDGKIAFVFEAKPGGGRSRFKPRAKSAAKTAAPAAAKKRKKA